MRTRRFRGGGAGGANGVGGAVGLWWGDHPVLVVLALNSSHSKPARTATNYYSRRIGFFYCIRAGTRYLDALELG
jgi:hypothetical protein